ncbi:MAG: hypothetical protein ACLSHV_12330 [Hominisplanchenecus sp.]
MGFFDKALKKVQDVGENIAASANNVKTVVETSVQDTMEITGLKRQIRELEKEMDAQYLQIGKKYAEFVADMDDAEPETAENEAAEATESSEVIDEVKEEAIDEVKAEAADETVDEAKEEAADEDEEPVFDVSDFLTIIKQDQAKKKELENQLAEVEKRAKQNTLLREKTKAEESFEQEKGVLDKALAMEIISKEEYEQKLNIARKKVENFEEIKKNRAAVRDGHYHKRRKR